MLVSSRPRTLGTNGKVGMQMTGTAGTTSVEGGNAMAWTAPKIVEICVGLEINSYASAET